MDALEKYLTVLFDGLEGFVYAPGKTGVADWRQRFFQWPQERENLESWIRTAGMEHDVYVCPSIFHEKIAKKSAVKGSQVTWIEFDGQESINLEGLPQPNLVIQTSSPTHQHVYWRIPFTPSEAIESINRRLTYGLGADMSGWDCTQVLRPPNTINFKRNLPVNLLAGAHRNFTLPSAFDKFSEPPPPVNQEDLSSIPDPLDVLGSNSLPKKIWEMINNPQTQEPHRSTFLMRLGYELAEVGLLHAEIVSLLVVADERVGKFVGRDDRLIRLAEIASIAIGKHGAAGSQPVYNFVELSSLNIKFEYVWAGLLREKGSLLCSGAPGVGKTQFGFHAATSFVLGQNFLAREVPKQQRIVFFSLEMDAEGCKYIIEHQAKALTPEAFEILRDNFFIVPVEDELTYEQIEKIVGDITNVTGVFIDTMGDLAQDELSNEKEARRIGRITARLRSELGLFVWWTHHTRKPNADNKAPTSVNDIFGSYVIAAKIDTAIILHPGKLNNSPIKLITPKVRYGKIDKEGVDILRTEHLTFTLKNPPKEIDVSPEPEPTDGPPELNIE